MPDSSRLHYALKSAFKVSSKNDIKYFLDVCILSNLDNTIQSGFPTQSGNTGSGVGTIWDLVAPVQHCVQVMRKFEKILGAGRAQQRIFNSEVKNRA